MPHSESTNATFAMMWLMAIGFIICAIIKSPLAFAFLFALMYCFFGLLRRFGSPESFEDDDDQVEMEPLGKIRGDMTLGEILAKY